MLIFCEVWRGCRQGERGRDVGVENVDVAGAGAREGIEDEDEECLSIGVWMEGYYQWME